MKFARTHSNILIILARVFSCPHARIIVYASSFHAVFSNLKLTQTQTDTRNHMPCFNKGAVADTFRVLKETSFMFAMLKETYVG